MKRLLITLALTILLGACASHPPLDTSGDGPPARDDIPDLSQVQDAVPRHEPRSRYGNPAFYEVAGKRYTVMDSAEGYAERGIASWYGKKFHGRRTSSGEAYDMYAMTAAHKSLPLPTYVRVKNLENGREVTVRVNDRGPFVKNRIIDLSYAAASKLGVLEKGTAPVEIRVVMPDQTANPTPETHTSVGVNYYLQVGAFSARANALRLSREVSSQIASVPARVEAAAGATGTVHRVRLGPLASVAEVDALAARLEALGFPDSHIVVVD